MGFGESLGQFAIGAVQGLDYGVGRGMELRGQYNQLQDQAETRAAKQDLNRQFQEAAKAGGLDKMPNEWFASVGANIMRTGDLENATAFMQMNTQIRTQKAQAAGQRASIALTGNNPKAALGDLNSAFDAIGMPSKIVGMSPDGAGYQMSDGSVMPAQAAFDITTQLMLTPKDALAYRIEQGRLQSTQAVAESTIDRNEATTNSINTLLGPKAQAFEASAAASRAAAENSRANANQTALLTPGKIREQAATTAKSEFETKEAIRLGPIKEEQERLAVAGERQEQAQSAELHGPALIEHNAKAIQEAQRAAIPPTSTDTRWQGVNATVKAQSDMWDQQNTDITSGEMKAGAEINMADPYSPILRGSTASGAAKLLAKDPSMSPDAASEQSAAVHTGMVQVVGTHPANIELTPEKAAKAVAEIISNPNVEQEQDEQGLYIVINIDGVDTKVYTGAPQQAIPTP